MAWHIPTSTGDVAASTTYECSLTCQSGAAAAGSNAANLPPAGDAILVTAIAAPESLRCLPIYCLFLSTQDNHLHLSYHECCRYGKSHLCFWLLVQESSRHHMPSTTMASNCRLTQRCTPDIVITKGTGALDLHFCCIKWVTEMY